MNAKNALFHLQACYLLLSRQILGSVRVVLPFLGRVVSEMGGETGWVGVEVEAEVNK